MIRVNTRHCYTGGFQFIRVNCRLRRTLRVSSIRHHIVESCFIQVGSHYHYTIHCHSIRADSYGTYGHLTGDRSFPIRVDNRLRDTVSSRFSIQNRIRFCFSGIEPMQLLESLWRPLRLKMKGWSQKRQQRQEVTRQWRALAAAEEAPG